MVQNKFRHFREGPRQLFQVSNIQKPTIKILLYTDAPRLVTRRRVGPFALGRMIEHLQGHAPAFARFDVRLESRYLNNSVTANNKLNDLLEAEAKTGDPFDQIWFFGVHQINKTSPRLELGGGTRESELTAKEVTALTTWMEEHHGGVLVTGDHANERPRDAIAADPNPLCPDTARNERFLGLGRALGRCIKRAGQLRVWEGDPTAERGHTVNTHFTVRGVPIGFEGLQHDALPQQISHQLFDPSGRPAADGQPHPIFFYRDGQFIQFLPDHMHEGAVRLPSNLADETIWKRANGFQPQPQIIATGFDVDRGATVELLAAYDGTAVNVGRIVADSSWHHYFNINLESLTFPAAAPDSPADQIGQFYANLAVWLCPIQKRQQMADAMIQWLAKEPVILEVFGPTVTENRSALLGTGGAALALLKRVASPCEIHELMQMTLSEERRQQSETIHFPEESAGLTNLPSKELLLGYIVNRSSQNSNEFRTLATTDAKQFTEATRAESINASELAFRRQRREITRALQEAERSSPPPDLSSLDEVGSQPDLSSSDQKKTT